MTRDVLILAGAFHERGGVQLRWRRLAEDLARDRRVVVVTWAPTWRLRRSTDGAIDVVVVPSLAGWDRDHPRWLELANTAVSVASGVLACFALRRRWQAAIGVGLHPEGTVAALASIPLRRPFLADTWLVGPIGNVARARRSMGGRAALRLLRRARAVLCVTAVGERELVDAGLDPVRVERTPLELDLDRWPVRHTGSGPHTRSASGRRRVVYAGRFDLRQKRLDLLLGGWDAAAAGWELLLVGAGPDEGAVRALAARTKGGVVVSGWTDDVAGVLADADGFVLPTEFESPGYALLEGMACGLPGVASAIDVYDELAPDGVRLVGNTMADWADALEWITGIDDAERTELGIRARAWVEASVGDGAAHLDRLLEG